MPFLLQDVDPLLDHSVDWGGLLELLVGVHELAVEKDGLSIGQSSRQLIYPQTNLCVKKKNKDELQRTSMGLEILTSFFCGTAFVFM